MIWLKARFQLGLRHYKHVLSFDVFDTVLSHANTTYERKSKELREDLKQSATVSLNTYQTLQSIVQIWR